LGSSESPREGDRWGDGAIGVKKGLSISSESRRPANATCSNELVDGGGDGRLTFLTGRGGTSSDLDVRDDDEAVNGPLLGLVLLFRGAGSGGVPWIEVLLRTCRTRSFSSSSSAFFIVRPVLLACRLCFINVEVTCVVFGMGLDENVERPGGADFDGVNVGVFGYARSELCFGGGWKALDACPGTGGGGLRGGKGGSLWEPSWEREEENVLERSRKGLFGLRGFGGSASGCR
jgi:hypothetical protein